MDGDVLAVMCSWIKLLQTGNNVSVFFFVLDTSIVTDKFIRFLAQYVIYTSRAYATMSVSVCLSVCL